ncbi:prepilin-type N-terminal cleavage/methylation domain-containing protein [Candidatus Saccharibacteria bacterium]|nr:MAG: prepilin-type N-terminal cleavage/methylation domain-containing protein [Candidatus Saccharibacteria bacterium]
MLRNLKKRSEGFTIIEVLIVLAIAGLILLIVFLAVPALQRNSRNSGRKSDVSRIGGAVIEFMNNNNGEKPQSTDLPAIKNAIGSLGQYDSASATAITLEQFSASLADYTPNKDTVRIVVGAKCRTGTTAQQGNTPASSNIGKVEAAGSRQVALQWASEGGSNSLSRSCTEF